jgi:hypothetical protein
MSCPDSLTDVSGLPEAGRHDRPPDATAIPNRPAVARTVHDDLSTLFGPAKAM